MSKNNIVCRRPPQVWGNTEFPDDERNKRVFVKGFNVETVTIDDLLNFFGRDSILGIKIVPIRGYARIQFKRNADQTGAIAKHKMQLKDRTIIVEPDYSTSSSRTRRVTPPSCRNNLQSQRISREPPSRHSSYKRRSRSRSPRRRGSYDRSPERSGHRQQYAGRDLAIRDYAAPNSSYQLQPAKFQAPDFQSAQIPGLRPADPFVGDSVMNNYTGANAQVVFPPIEPKPVAQTFFQSHHVVPHQQYVPPQPATPALTNGVGQLPSSITLALQLVLSHNSARNLSIEQIQDVINYFQAEKRFLLQKFTDANTDIPPQITPQSQQVAISVQQNQPDINRQAQPEEDSPQVSTEELDALEGTLRMMREASRN